MAKQRTPIYKKHLLWCEMCECERLRLRERQKEKKQTERKIKWRRERKRGRGKTGLGFPCLSLLQSNQGNDAGTGDDATVHTHMHTQPLYLIHTVQRNCPEPSPSISQTAYGCSTASLSPLLSPSLWASSLTSVSLSHSVSFFSSPNLLPLLFLPSLSLHHCIHLFFIS